MRNCIFCNRNLSESCVQKCINRSTKRLNCDKKKSYIASRNAKKEIYLAKTTHNLVPPTMILVSLYPILIDEWNCAGILQLALATKFGNSNHIHIEQSEEADDLSVHKNKAEPHSGSAEWIGRDESASLNGKCYRALWESWSLTGSSHTVLPFCVGVTAI